MMRRHAVAVIILGLGACATPGQVRRVETQLAVMERNQARADSARAAELTMIISLQRRMLDSLNLASRTIASIKGEMSAEFTESRRQMLQVQTLMGQSQQRLTELRNQLEARSDVPTTGAPGMPVTPADSSPSASLGVPAGTPSAEVMYSQAQRQLAQGSMSTARSAFRDLLKYYPTSPRVPDALYGIAESFAAVPDSQFLYYSDVERTYPRSAVAPRALFKLAVLEEQRGNRTQARVYYQRVIDRYPDWEDIDLVRDRLRTRQ
jgi:TolA-binding protein